jgi:predicted nucleotidyltransferase
MNATLQRGVTVQINLMVERIATRFDPERIILFGSHARGDARPDSDVDLMVVMDVVGSKREKQVELLQALHDIRIPKDIIVVTPDELERQKRHRRNPCAPCLAGGESALCLTLKNVASEGRPADVSASQSPKGLFKKG